MLEILKYLLSKSSDVIYVRVYLLKCIMVSILKNINNYRKLTIFTPRTKNENVDTMFWKILESQ